MAYTQADIKQPTYMELPPGINFPNMTKESHCLKILKNIYGGKESGKVWFEHLKTVLTTTMKYTQSKFDKCIFFKDHTIFFIYTDDGIFVDPNPKTVSQRIHELSTVFEIENQGNLHEYLGIKNRTSKGRTDDHVTASPNQQHP